MATIITDFAELRKFASANSKRAWYKAFCTAWNADGPREAQAVLKSHPNVLIQLKALAPNYWPGKVGPSVNRSELYAIRKPQLPNTCGACGKLVAYSDPLGTWKSGCTMKCAALMSVKQRETTMMDRYGVRNPSNDPKAKRKRTRTIQKRFGVKNAFESEEVKRRIKKTMVAKYGVEYTSQSPVIQERMAINSMIKRGVTHWTKDADEAHKLRPFTPENLAKAKRTHIERYGVDSPFKNPEVRDQIHLTNIDRYGCANPFGSEEIKAKLRATNLDRYGVEHPGVLSVYKRKSYTDRFGVTHSVQGFEPRALAFFDKQKTVVRIKTGARSVPRYRYRLNGKQHNYYPDMIVFTATRAHVVEVKSTYYLLRDLDKNLAKFSRATRRCLKQDRTFWLFCYLADGSLIRVKNPTTKDQLRAAGIPVDGLR